MESVCEATLKVTGMHCSSCANTVEKALKDLEGVHQVTVALEENEVTMEYEDDKVTVKNLDEAIKSSGYTFEGVK